MAKRNSKKRAATRRQAWGVLLSGISLLLFLAIVSFSVKDPVNLNVAGNQVAIRNWLGPAGAALSYYLMQGTLGYPILVLPIIIMMFAVNLITGKKTLNRGRQILFLSVWAVVISIFLAMPEAINTLGRIKEYYPSGLIGGWIASGLVLYLGKFGGLAMLILFALALLVATIRIEVADLFYAVQGKLAGSFDSVSVGLAKMKEKREERKRIKAEKKRKKEMQADIVSENEIAPEPQPEIPPEINITEISQKPLKPEPDLAKPQPQTEKKIKPNQITLDEILAGLDDEPPAPAEETAGALENAQNGDDLGFEVEAEKKDVEMDYDALIRESIKKYKFPSTDLLKTSASQNTQVTRDELKANAELLEYKLLDFGVKAKVIKVTAGPVITLYELQPSAGVKVSSIVNLSNDLALAMEARGIRIIAPIPGKAAVGIEIPNRNPQIVYLKSLIRSQKFAESSFELPIAVGKTIAGESYIADLAKMPHLLIAGATGSGKSVGINTTIASLLFSVNPAKVKFMMIDPKKLELSLYKNLRNHYLLWRPDLDEEIITKPNNAVSMLNSMVLEMEKRYDILANFGVRNIVEFNKKIDNYKEKAYKLKLTKLPYIVVIIDELADLMLLAAKEVETPIARLAQMARAVGIHLIVATQRPSVNVITGVIKANFPARIAYQVATKVDSRTILDINGAEQLLGNGDMLFLPPGQSKPVRLQNPFLSTEEVESIIDHIKKQSKLPYYSVPQPASSKSGAGGGNGGDRDPLYEDARAIVVQHQQGSSSLLQRRLKVGYSRAARLIDELEQDGIVGPQDGSKAREVLITLEELRNMV